MIPQCEAENKNHYKVMVVEQQPNGASACYLLDTTFTSIEQAEFFFSKKALTIPDSIYLQHIVLKDETNEPNNN